MRSSKIYAAIVCCLVSGCVAESDEDGANDSFAGADGKGDGSLSDAEIAGVLAYVNQASKASLSDDAQVGATAATNITEHRAGADKKLDTSDDDTFDTLGELDDVPYVGPKALQKLLDYARAHGFLGTAEFCKSQHAGTAKSGAPIQVCDELFDSAPFVHVPADQANGANVTIYGSVMPTYGLHLFAADGRDLTLVKSGQRIYQDPAPKGWSMPENMFTIYAVSGTLTTLEMTDAIEVSTLTPVAAVPGKVQDAHLKGTWEAKAAMRVDSRKFDKTQPVAFRFTLSTTADSTIWGSYPGTDGLVVKGSIDNYSARVKASDGTCLPTLASLGSASPFYNATAPTIGLWRHPNMHGINDQVIVMDYPPGSVDLSQNGMSGVGPFSVAGLIQDAGPNYGSVTVYPHATPTGHQVWDLHKVTTGGQACP